MEEHEINAALAGGRMGGEYLVELGQTDMSKLTPAQWQEFVCCICKEYHLRRVQAESLRADIPY